MAAKPKARKRRPRGDGGLTQRKNGLWVGSVELPLGEDGKRRPRRQVTSMDYNTALKKLRDLQRAIDDGQIPVTDTTTVEAWLKRWLDEIIYLEVSPKTLIAYRSAVNSRIVPFVGNRRLAKLTPTDVRAMTKGIIDRGQASGSALDAYRVLSKALTDAKNEGLIRENVCDRVAVPKVTRVDRGAHELDQVRKLFTYLIESEDPMLSRWAMALMTGQRQAECLGLEWDRVDFERGEIDVAWTLQWLKLKDRYARQSGEVYDKELFDVRPGFDFRPVWRTACMVPPKTVGSRRIVPMIAPLAATMKAHHVALGEPTSGLVWTRDGGRPLRKVDDSTAWHAALEGAGVPDLTLHSARHSVATLLQSAGVDEVTRMAIMGHSSKAAQRVYAHVDTSRSRLALDQLGDDVFGAITGGSSA